MGFRSNLTAPRHLLPIDNRVQVAYKLMVLMQDLLIMPEW